MEAAPAGIRTRACPQPTPAGPTLLAPCSCQPLPCSRSDPWNSVRRAHPGLHFFSPVKIRSGGAVPARFRRFVWPVLAGFVPAPVVGTGWWSGGATEGIKFQSFSSHLLPQLAGISVDSDS
ncbi:hypothetical protein GQ55_2G042400 [Panicum hallii var. hallii]|uniref:Uncharacterized protein n=1 Tax=Panicum hallii var. hallii TaxID=1504633 RepID=A0A2T7ELA7_9POAL|nr:hypothetical protein GQ55_2G042400 [Panicum hallii var. hallii]